MYTAQEIESALINYYYDVAETSLSKLTDAEFSQISYRWARGVDWNIHKIGKRWQIGGEHFSAFPMFKTKKAAYEAAEQLILAESKHRAKLQLEAKLAQLKTA